MHATIQAWRSGSDIQVRRARHEALKWPRSSSELASLRLRLSSAPSLPCALASEIAPGPAWQPSRDASRRVARGTNDGACGRDCRRACISERANGLIGAVAVAVHGYPRATEDVDLAAATDLATLRIVGDEFAAQGCTVRLGEPDAEDSLGGVLTIVRDDTDPVQIVNYANPFRPGSGALAAEAIDSATAGSIGSLAVVDLPHLVALKLYAGGAKSKLDVVELLARNSEADRSRYEPCVLALDSRPSGTSCVGSDWVPRAFRQ